jgi:hypothetical protein
VSAVSERDRVAALFRRLGAPEDRAGVMAAQLLKRSEQIARQRGIPRAEAARGLLSKVIGARGGFSGPSHSGSHGGITRDT